MSDSDQVGLPAESVAVLSERMREAVLWFGSASTAEHAQLIGELLYTAALVSARLSGLSPREEAERLFAMLPSDEQWRAEMLPALVERDPLTARRVAELAAQGGTR